MKLENHQKNRMTQWKDDENFITRKKKCVCKEGKNTKKEKLTENEKWSASYHHN